MRLEVAAGARRVGIAPRPQGRRIEIRHEEEIGEPVVRQAFQSVHSLAHLLPARDVALDPEARSCILIDWNGRVVGKRFEQRVSATVHHAAGGLARAAPKTSRRGHSRDGS